MKSSGNATDRITELAKVLQPTMAAHRKSEHLIEDRVKSLGETLDRLLGIQAEEQAKQSPQNEDSAAGEKNVEDSGVQPSDVQLEPVKIDAASKDVTMGSLSTLIRQVRDERTHAETLWKQISEQRLANQ